jgi:hypothetical protein
MTRRALERGKEEVLAMIARLGVVLALAITFIFPYNAKIAFAGPPYPSSPVITGLTWAPESTIVRKATESDNWPITWADDDNLYTAYGDGFGFEPKLADKLSLGFARVEGIPPAFSGFNIHPSTGERFGGGASGKKASGMLMVDGTLYMWVRNANKDGTQSELAWSHDHAKTWTWSSWRFASLGYVSFLNFGKDYSGARDDYVYMYSPDTPSAYNETDHVVLMRVPIGQIKNRAVYEFFKELDTNGNPVWTNDISQRGPVFTFAGGCNRLDVTYDSGIGRYLMTMKSRAKAGGLNQFSIYDAPEPWGPWTTVYYTENWGVAAGESQHIPSKWISADGKTFYMVFSGGDSFSVRKATLTLATSADDTTPPTAPSTLTATPISESQINLTWSASSDPETGVANYNIYRDGAKVETATGTSYSDMGLMEDTTYSYEISAVNGAGLESAKSQSVSATTLAAVDTTPPTILSITASGDPSKVTILFDEPVEESSATDISNYSIDSGITISSASLGADLKVVTLTTSIHSEGPTYTLTVSNVRDRASTPNVIAPNTQMNYTFVVTQLVISNLTVASGKAYEVIYGGLVSGAKVYIDRGFVYSSVPDWLTGATYIKTANDDKSSTGDSFISFDVNQAVTIYVAHPYGSQDQPAWMASFSDTGADLVTTDRKLNLFMKDFQAGTVTLGGNDASSMYTIIVVGKDGTVPPSSPAAPTGLKIIGVQ